MCRWQLTLLMLECGIFLSSHHDLYFKTFFITKNWRGWPTSDLNQVNFYRFLNRNINFIAWESSLDSQGMFFLLYLGNILPREDHFSFFSLSLCCAEVRVMFYPLVVAILGFGASILAFRGTIFSPREHPDGPLLPEPWHFILLEFISMLVFIDS